MTKTRVTRIEGGKIYKAIEIASSKEVNVYLTGGDDPQLSVVGENRNVRLGDVTILEEVGDKLQDVPGK